MNTEITDLDGKKLVDIGQKPKKWKNFDNQKDPNGKRLWQWFMDFSPFLPNKPYKYFVTRGGGPNCNIKATFVCI